MFNVINSEICRVCSVDCIIKQTRDVGNATEDTEFTFQFSVREPELLALYSINNHLPFQLKIAFTKLDGMKWYGIFFVGQILTGLTWFLFCVFWVFSLRVISKSQAITAEREVAEKELDLVVLLFTLYY